jgi:hypothetical protein
VLEWGCLPLQGACQHSGRQQEQRPCPPAAGRRARRNTEPEAGVVVELVMAGEQEGEEAAALSVNIDYDAPAAAQPFRPGVNCSARLPVVPQQWAAAGPAGSQS